MDIELNNLHRNSYGLILAAIFLGTTFSPLMTGIITAVVFLFFLIAVKCDGQCCQGVNGSAKDNSVRDGLNGHVMPHLRFFGIVWFAQILTHGWLGNALIWLGTLLK